jgi:hypothetical protein
MVLPLLFALLQSSWLSSSSSSSSLLLSLGYVRWVMSFTTRISVHKFTFFPHSALVWFTTNNHHSRHSQQTAIIHPHSSNLLFQSRDRNCLLRGTSWKIKHGSDFFAESRFRSQGGPCEICGVRSGGTAAGFSTGTSVSPWQYVSAAPQSSSSTCGFSQNDKRSKTGKLLNAILFRNRGTFIRSVEGRAMARRLVSSLLQRRAEFDLRAAHVRSVVDKVALGLDCVSSSTSGSLCQHHSGSLSQHHSNSAPFSSTRCS